MKQLFSSKRILAFILTFIMIVSNIQLIPVYATGEETTTKATITNKLFSTDFDNSNVNSNGVTAKGTGTVQISSEGDEKYLEFNGTTNTNNKRVYKSLDLSGKDNLTVEMKVKTTGDVAACIGLSYKDQSYENDNSKNYSWTGSTNGVWQEVKVVYSLEDTVTSTAYIKNGNDWVESTTYTHLFPENENNRYLILKPLTNLTGDQTVCFDAVRVYYTKTYETLEGAIGDAASGETIEVVGNVALTKDITSTNANITIDSGVILNLNGFTLDMDDNYLYSSGDVVDNSTNKDGRLVVATDGSGNLKGKLAASNSQVPMYIDGEGYMFATMLGQFSESTTDDSFTVISRPSFGDAYEMLKDGSTEERLQFIIRLDWIENETSYYQPLKYVDDLVKTVYEEGKAFSATVNGLSAYKDSMKVSVLVKSDLGVEWVNNSFYMSTSNE